MDRKSEERERSGSISSRTSIDSNRSKKEPKNIDNKKDKKEKKFGKRIFIITNIITSQKYAHFPLRIVFNLTPEISA